MEPIKQENNEKVCPYCGKPWFYGEIVSILHPEKKRVLHHPSCDCEERIQRQQNTLTLNKEVEERRREKLRNEKNKRFDNSMITPLFRQKTFESLEQTNEVKQCQEYAKTFNPSTSQGIQMIGNVGTGKTTLLAAICNYLLSEGYTCLFTTLSALLDKFSKYSYDNAGDISGLLNWLTAYDFVVLDDIGREAYTDKRKEISFRIIDALLNQQVITAFTANPEMIEKLKNIPEWEATIDRLKEMCPLKFEFRGKSLRGVNNDTRGESA